MAPKQQSSGVGCELCRRDEGETVSQDHVVALLRLGEDERMALSVTGYSAQLDAWFRRDGREWLVWCPAIDVMTQARTKKRALESLREAVELWFESCIDRGVLDAALTEVGFTKVPPGEER